MTINGRRTSVRMERGFWEALEDVAQHRRLTMTDLVSQIDEGRGEAPLTRKLRVTAVSHFRELLNKSPDHGGFGREKVQSHGMPALWTTNV
ncbi:ribbon-helix-helix domain-containing protein [Azospirillum melinis]|nr:ribbon-helix-helix domain-containing protein [Azospirillum melinis]MBP2307488.1 putative DNA-binding ribbon-helix-helix protein [Azospirillum melinis]